MIREYLAQIKYELDELDLEYGHDFLVEGSGSESLVAHILFEKMLNEIRAELIRGSNTPYPSLRCLFQYSNDVVRALLRVQLTQSP